MHVPEILYWYLCLLKKILWITEAQDSPELELPDIPESRLPSESRLPPESQDSPDSPVNPNSQDSIEWPVSQELPDAPDSLDWPESSK